MNLAVKLLKAHVILLVMFGIVQAKTALVNRRTTGMRNMKSQYLSMIKPMIKEPDADPILPTIIEMQIAIALKMKRKFSNLNFLCIRL